MQKIAAAILTLLLASGALASQSRPAEARRGHGWIAIGIAAGVIGGIAISRHYHHRRHYVVDDYDDDEVDYEDDDYDDDDDDYDSYPSEVYYPHYRVYRYRPIYSYGRSYYRPGAHYVHVHRPLVHRHRVHSVRALHRHSHGLKHHRVLRVRH